MTTPVKVICTITGRINGGNFDGKSIMEIDLSTGTIQGEVIIGNPPPKIHTLAASGLSWWCNSNTGGGGTGGTTAKNLNDICGFNYTLKRRNEFPDGSAIDMTFTAKRVDEGHVEVVGHWDGNYGLSTDIVGIKGPILEHMRPEGETAIISSYDYVLLDRSGAEYRVHTPSQYTFRPDDMRTSNIVGNQTRMMFFSVTEVAHLRHYRAMSQSTIRTDEDLGVLRFTGEERDHFVRFA